LVSDKNITGIIDLLMDDVPKTELLGTLEATIKMLLIQLCSRVKFYKTPKSASCIIGYVFEKIKWEETHWRTNYSALNIGV